MSVVTRFAPSPTGFLHIGGARTALFNKLFARRMGGKYLLRIEDTDRARSTEAAIAAILDGLTWLGLAPDEPPVFQFARADRHREVAAEMIARGTAFRCYCTAEDVEALRAQAHAEGRALRSPYRDGKPAPSPYAPFVVRLRAPDDGHVVNPDLVQGEVRIAAREIDDLVLLRADGTPTYMHAVVVDDHDMGVTHVIRGDDHLTNAARQIPIYQAMGWPIPAFAHIPLIHGPDGTKLSKRHGALGVEAYREMGFLPEGLCAYLVRLGWSAPDREVTRIEEAAELFDLKGVVKSPARLDFDKMASVNAQYMREADDERLFTLLIEEARRREGYPLHDAARAKLRAAVPILKDRVKTVVELADAAYVFVRPRPLPLGPAETRALDTEAVARLARVRQALAAHEAWEAPALSERLKAFAAAEGVGFGKIGPALRAVLTAGAPAPDLGQVLALLGREETLARLDDQL